MAPQEVLQGNHDCIDQAEDAAKIQPPTASSSRKKYLVFRNFVECKWTSNLDDYTDMELCSMWYSRFEYQLMRNECLGTISKKMKHVPEDDSNCYRGFEEWKAKGAAARRKQAIRKRAQRDVFSVQDRLWDADEYKYNPVEIAAAYSSYSSCCSFEASRRGLEDAKQAHGAYYRVGDQ
jgi:hypothetical protein